MKRLATVSLLGVLVACASSPASMSGSQPQSQHQRQSPPPAESAAPPYRFVDATGPYLEFVESLPSLRPEERGPAFRAQVIGAHPELFAPSVIGLDPTRGEDSLDARLATYLPTLPSRAATMQKVAREIRASLGEHDATFRRAFPDMKWRGTVYFTASIDAFDGGLREVPTGEGKTELSLLFGIDKIVTIYGADVRIGPLFHHELFHCYHVDQNPSIVSTEESHGMLEPLWSEGLAVYVASRLNPGTTNRELTLTDEMITAADARLGAIAAELRSQLDDTSELTYRDFFLGAGKRQDLPKRVGYYIGFRVARIVAERHGGNLPELARLARPQLRTEVDEALASLR